jgi:glycosyltransferase involved in cell wall biosynthesis
MILIVLIIFIVLTISYVSDIVLIIFIVLIISYVSDIILIISYVSDIILIISYVSDIILIIFIILIISYVSDIILIIFIILIISYLGETFGFNHVEASSHGLPVIAFDMLANRESIATGVFVQYERGRLIINLADAIVETYLLRHRSISSAQERVRYVKETCATARSMYRHWNSRQHSLALISLLDEIIPLL